MAAERLAKNFADAREWELVEIVARRVATAEKKRSIPGKGVSWPQAAIGVVELVKNTLSNLSPNLMFSRMSTTIQRRFKHSNRP